MLCLAGQERSIPVILNLGRPQARQAVPVDKPLPAQKLVDRQLIAFASVVEAQEPSAHSGDNFGLAAYNPALCVWRRKVGYREGAAIRAEDVTEAGAEQIGHSTLTRDQDHDVHFIPARLKGS
jgi:hypothetical protein